MSTTTVYRVYAIDGLKRWREFGQDFATAAQATAARDAFAPHWPKYRYVARRVHINRESDR